MNRFFKVIKFIFCGLLVIYSLAIVYFLFFLPKEKRFRIAEHSQGIYLSQSLFDILIFQHPDYSNAYFEKSVAFNKRGDYNKGFNLLNKAVEINPKLHLGYHGWLRLVKLKDYEGCIADLKMLDSLTPNFVDAAWGENIHYLMGISYMGLNENKMALTEFDNYLRSEKDSSWVDPYMYMYKAVILKQDKELGMALKNLDACIAYNEYSPEAYYHKGVIYKEMGKSDSADVLLNKALNLYQKGYKKSDYYNEVPCELYLSDIKSALEKN